MLQFYNYNLKKKKFYNSLAIYFLILKYRILLFFQKLEYTTIKLFKENNFIKITKINIIELSKIFKNNDNISNKILNKNFIIIASKQYDIFNILNNVKNIIKNIIMISIYYYFINIKFIKNINLYINLYTNNYINLNINLYKFFFTKICYIKYIINKKKI